MHIHTCIHRGKINRYTIYISDGHICNTIFIIAQKSNALKCLNIRAPSAILSFFVMFLTFFMSSLPGLAPFPPITHTFSCISFQFDSVQIYSFACVNMSMIAPPCGECVENNGFEPLTPCLQSRCSSQLS